MTVPIHPFIVHFAVALYSISIFFDLFAFRTRKKQFSQCGFLILLLSGIAVLLAVVSGLVEENRITISSTAQSDFAIHETLAFVTASLIMVQVFWRIGLKNKLLGKIRRIYLSLSLVGLISLFAGAYYGGRLVYIHGTGVGIGKQLQDESPQKSSGKSQAQESDWFLAPEDTVEK
jgi:uncharacterized membrane protein